ncbi:unnamed protein product [Spirodela intermedia]|uniref:Uncharacterized protein n=2 Tax=Spirodela intermedia TaxID=51605 RepID=A0A7I8JMQ7_SPIIN|nr:unnamed protein product [Spirodela intermedia]CAA6671091.1 unnamed protein product [Spirodela intermedia]CAA7408201.1 unnamed protein product [Spirodela intermedia]
MAVAFLAPTPLSLVDPLAQSPFFHSIISEEQKTMTTHSATVRLAGVRPKS